MEFFSMNTDAAYLLLSNLCGFAFCIFLALYMYFVLDEQNSTYSRVVFKKFIIVAVACLVCDMLTYVFDRQTFFGATVLNHVVMFLSIVITVYIGGLWNLFFDVNFHVTKKRKLRIILYNLPTLIAIVCLIVNVFTGWIFRFDEANVYSRGPVALVSFFLQYVMYAVLIIRALVFKFSVKTIRYAKLRLNFILVAVITLFFGVLQIAAGGNVALHCCGITSGIFIMFLRFQDDQITNDLLTGLNNRYALDTYIEDKIKNYSDGSHGRTRLYLVMMDVNYFKRINDLHGHLEGDRALKSVATTLKKVGGSYRQNLFIARFGGDEFSAVFETSSEQRVVELCNEIKNTLTAETADFGYPITIGAGYARYVGKTMTLPQLYEKADKALYEDKDKMKNGQGDLLVP